LIRSEERTGICHNRKSWAKAIIFGALFLLICALIILSCVPPISKDALTHHLAVPKLYLKHGGIYEIPSMLFSYYPMNLDLIYMIPLYFGNDIVPKLIHFTFALLTAWLLFSYLRRRINITYALLGALFFLSIPIVVKLSITAYVDLGLVFFSTASLLMLFRWVDLGFQLRFLIFSAMFCGLAMGIKYNGLITCFLLTLFTPFISARSNQAERHKIIKPLGYGFLFLSVAMIIFSPWMIRNYLWTGNPIYPLYDQWFNPDHVAGRSIGFFAYRALAYHEGWGEMLLLPLRIFFQGQDGKPQFFDGKLNPFLLIFTIIAFYHLKKDSEKIKAEKKILFAFTVLYFTFAFFSSGLRIRYISPIIPPLAILAIFGIKRMIEAIDEFSSLALKNMGKAVLVCLALFAISLNAIYIYSQFEYVKPFSYISGNVNRDDYIEKYRPEYAAMKFINGHLPMDSKILFVFIGNRGYYCDRRYRFDMEGNRSQFEALLKSSHDPKAVWESLKREGITHVLINIGIFNRWASQSFSALDLTQVRSFFNGYLHLLYHKNGYGVFKIKQSGP